MRNLGHEPFSSIVSLQSEVELRDGETDAGSGASLSGGLHFCRIPPNTSQRR
jgi:hypothetical protein